MWSLLAHYYRPETVNQALVLLARTSPRTVALAGGTWLVAQRDPAVEDVVDLSALNRAYVDERGRRLRLGAMSKLPSLMTSLQSRRLGNVLLAEAARRYGPRATCSVATLGGTLVVGAATCATITSSAPTKARPRALFSAHVRPGRPVRGEGRRRDLGGWGRPRRGQRDLRRRRRAAAGGSGHARAGVARAAKAESMAGVACCDLDDFVKGLADQTRQHILALLHEREMSVGELTEHLSVTQLTISHHLALLRRAHLVSPRHDGRQTFYRANPACVAECCQEIRSRYEPAMVEKIKAGGRT